MVVDDKTKLILKDTVNSTKCKIIAVIANSKDQSPNNE